MLTLQCMGGATVCVGVSLGVLCVCLYCIVASGVRTSVNTLVARPALPFNIKMPVSLQLLTLFQP